VASINPEHSELFPQERLIIPKIMQDVENFELAQSISPFTKLSRNMNNQNLEQKIREHVENNAVVTRFTEKSDHKVMSYNDVKVGSPELDDEGIPKKYFFEVFKTPDDVGNPKERSESLWSNTTNLSKKEERLIKEAFEKIVRQIMDFMADTTVKEKKTEIIYKACPQMLCGNNPCSCRKEFEKKLNNDCLIEKTKREVEITGLKINGKTQEEVLGKDWKKKFENLSGEDIIKEGNRLKRLINAERVKEVVNEQQKLAKVREKLNKYIVGSKRNEKTGYQMCKFCGRDVVDIKNGSRQALETIKIYEQHEKEYHE
jgi:hypothetical protein